MNRSASRTRVFRPHESRCSQRRNVFRPRRSHQAGCLRDEWNGKSPEIKTNSFGRYRKVFEHDFSEFVGHENSVDPITSQGNPQLKHITCLDFTMPEKQNSVPIRGRRYLHLNGCLQEWSSSDWGRQLSSVALIASNACSTQVISQFAMGKSLFL